MSIWIKAPNFRRLILLTYKKKYGINLIPMRISDIKIGALYTTGFQLLDEYGENMIDAISPFMVVDIAKQQTIAISDYFQRYTMKVLYGNKLLNITITNKHIDREYGIKEFSY